MFEGGGWKRVVAFAAAFVVAGCGQSYTPDAGADSEIRVDAAMDAAVDAADDGAAADAITVVDAVVVDAVVDAMVVDAVVVDAVVPDSAPSDGAADAAGDTAVDAGPAALIITPTTHDFGMVAPGAAPTTVFTVTNVGGAPTGTITTMITTGAAHFDVVSTTCTSTLAPGASCVITVRYSPPLGAAGSAHSGAVTATDGTAMATATLQGSVAALVATPGVGTFMAGCGETPTPITFTIENTTSGDVGPLAVMMGGTHPADFIVGTDACTGTILAPGETCMVTVLFGASFPGVTRSAQLIVGSGAFSVVVPLSGFADYAQLSITPATASFTRGPPPSTTTFTVQNVGTCSSGVPTASLIGAGAAHFNIVSDGCTAALPPGGTCLIGVRYEPTTTGSTSAQLEVTGGATTATSTLTGT